MMYQPPSLSGGIDRPCSGPGGSSASQKSWRRNSGIDQPTCASMLNPTITNHSVPVSRLITPSIPRLIGPICALPIQPMSFEKDGLPERSLIRRPPVSSRPISGGPCTCTCVNMF